MIVNVRGTSGSGKSTLVRAVMEHYRCEPIRVEGRRQPLYYDCWSKADPTEPSPELRVLGHYETPCGGCDTISKNHVDPSERATDYVQRLVREADDLGLHVLYESVILSTIPGDVTEFVREGRDVVVVNLATTLDECLRGIAERRLARRAERLDRLYDESHVEREAKELPDSTIRNCESKLKSAARTAAAFREAGIVVFDRDRENALQVVEEVLGIS